MGTMSSFPRNKADHSPPLGTDVKKAWGYTSTPQYVFMAWGLVKNKDNLNVILICLH
jgi:hypothetical protein